MLVHFRRQDDPVSRNLYADLYIQTRTAKYLRQRQAAGVRGGQAPGPEATLGKLSLSRNMAMVTRFVSAVLGSTLIADSGEWGDFAWSEFVCGTPGFRLGGGPKGRTTRFPKISTSAPVDDTSGVPVG